MRETGLIPEVRNQTALKHRPKSPSRHSHSSPWTQPFHDHSVDRNIESISTSIVSFTGLFKDV